MNETRHECGAAPGGDPPVDTYFSRCSRHRAGAPWCAQLSPALRTAPCRSNHTPHRRRRGGHRIQQTRTCGKQHTSTVNQSSPPSAAGSEPRPGSEATPVPLDRRRSAHMLAGNMATWPRLNLGPSCYQTVPRCSSNTDARARTPNPRCRRTYCRSRFGRFPERRS